MAQLNPENLFQSWLLSPQEFLQGSLLTGAQKQVIQNQIAQLAIQKSNLNLDPTNILPFMQQEAEFKGQILALQYLLTLSQEAETQLNPGSQSVHLSGQPSPQE